jgi:hypothetical protein
MICEHIPCSLEGARIANASYVVTLKGDAVTGRLIGT